MSLNGVFQPPNIHFVPPNRLPPNKIPQPPNKKFFALRAIHNVLALAFKTQYASALPHNTLHVHIATTTKFRSSNIMDQ